MAAINLRTTLERPLSIAEVDANFTNLNDELSTKLPAASYNSVEILTLLKDKAGEGSFLNADMVHGYYPNMDEVGNTVVVRTIQGDIKGNNIFGTHIGNVQGNVQGNLTGTVTGNATNVNGVVQIEHGGTGATTATNARLALGMGDMSIQQPNAVNIIGGSISGITDLAVADGGTGASSEFDARENLGVQINKHVQQYAAILSNISNTTGVGIIGRNTDGTIFVRSLAVGNSLSVTNANGSAGNPTLALVTNPTVSSIQKSGTSGTGDIGSSTNLFGTIYGTATSAKYADLAEKYTTDQEYTPGTVIVINPHDGAESTASFKEGQRVLGVISTDPAYLMNSESEGQPIALRGRVPVKVRGPIRKGEALICDNGGVGIAGDTNNSFAMALESNMEEGVKMVECVIL